MIRYGCRLVRKDMTGKRRKDVDIFLQLLEELTTKERPLISNNTLKNKLKWTQERYDKTSKKLRTDKKIIIGKGQGGSVGLAKSPSGKALTVFLSYSHLDNKLKEDVVKHLDPLKKSNLIDAWFDGKITPGNNIDNEIKKFLSKADIILLLISIDFINSFYCIEVEMQEAMSRHEREEARVIPIILRNCLWDSMPFSKLKALPPDGKAVNSWPDRDEAMVSIVKGIRDVAKDILNQ